MPTPTTFLEHLVPDNLDTQAAAIQVALDSAYLRGLELMFMEIRELFAENPEIMEASFDIDGDINNFPTLSCLNDNNEDIGDGMADVDSLAEAWNERMTPPTLAFLEHLEGHCFRRPTFAQDTERACGILKKQSVFRRNEHGQAWVESFISHLKGMAMEQSLPMAQPGRRYDQPRF